MLSVHCLHWMSILKPMQSSTVISDNYFSTTVVSYQKKDCCSHFVSYFLHVKLSILTSAATDVAATAYRFLSTFFSFSSLSFSTSFLYLSSATSADGFRTPGGELGGFPVLPYPRYLLIPGDFRFVLLCTHRAPGSSCPRLPCFFRKTFNFILVPSDWAFDCLERFQSVHHACASVRYRNAPEALSYQNPHRKQPAVARFFACSYLVLEHIALGLGDSQDYQIFSNPPASPCVSPPFVLM
jgi:hypothetical protein